MKEQTSTSKILDSMDEGTKYSTPIFGSEASDVAMPRLKMNAQPVEPRITYEMIKEYLSIEGNATQNLTTFCQRTWSPWPRRSWPRRWRRTPSTRTSTP